MRILITGAADGIGKATAGTLAAHGHDVVIHGRPGKKLERAAGEIAGAAAGETSVDTISADFLSLKEVAGAAVTLRERFPDLTVLINNAGIASRTRQESHDGYEATFAVNHLAPMLLTQRLVPLLAQNAPSRIVVVSSMVHAGAHIDFDDLNSRRSYDGMRAYGMSKLANIYMTRVLAEELKPAQITVNALHPGVISTKLLHEYFSGGSAPDQGARTPVYLATSPEVAETTGRYFVNEQPASTNALDDPAGREEAYRLYRISEEMINRALS